MAAIVDFALAQLVALPLSTAGTLVVDHFSNNPLLLTVAGPVAEKIGFPTWETMKELVRPTKDLSAREKLKKIRDGTINTLFIDVFHDLIYVSLFGASIYLEKRTVSEVSPAVLAPACFIAASILAPPLRIESAKLTNRFIFPVLRHMLASAWFLLHTGTPFRFNFIQDEAVIHGPKDSMLGPVSV